MAPALSPPAGDDVRLVHGEPFNAKYRILAPTRLATRMEPPFDGTVKGRITGSLAGPFEGELCAVTFKPALPLRGARNAEK